MLAWQQARGQAFRAVGGVDGDSRLRDQRPGIERRDHRVHAGAMFAVAGVERALVRMQSGVFR